MGKPKRIPAAQLPEPQNIKFSFKHLDQENEKYALSKCCATFYANLVLALVRNSKLTVEEFRAADHDEGRHPLYFPDTSEPEGFPLDPETLGLEEPWQIRLCPNIHRPPESAWRLHGVLLNDVFYVVWFDYEHLLYQNDRFGPGE
jgi:hypothetical protein